MTPCNDDAAFGVMFWFFLSISVVVFAWIVCGAIMDEGSSIHSSMVTSGTVPVSQERDDAMAMMEWTFGGFLVIFLVLSVFVAIMAARERQNRMA